MRTIFKTILTLLSAASSMLASPLQKVDPELEAWVQSTSVRTDPDAVNWIKEHLKTDPHILASKNSSSIDLSGFGKTKCTNNTVADDIDSPIYVLISFSVPTESWVNLSKEMEKVGGVFVLRGLPENSFKALSQKILLLNDLGVTIPIQINPKLFGEFDVKVVPTIIVRDGDKYDKISGNVSLSYALETIQKEAL